MGTLSFEVHLGPPYRSGIDFVLRVADISARLAVVLQPSPPQSPMQRLILLFDGTWNEATDRTNVFRLVSHLRQHDGDITQRYFYDEGVGTERFNRFMGGGFGIGVNKNIRQGYEWLVKRYEEGDEIWLFGFSRGAYTARSLAGLLRKCGLLRVHTRALENQAFSLYRDKSVAPESPAAISFRKDFSREVRVRFLGVWDTVGALGVPTFAEGASANTWHDTELSSRVDYAYQAMALDEHRCNYEVPLWVTDSGLKKPENLDVEQRWFIGAHANVGGGYGAKDPLPDLSLAWMMSKAMAVGLKLDPFQPRPDAWMTEPADSYKAFLLGSYRIIKTVATFGNGRFYRRYATGREDRPAVNVSVDDSVWMRWHDPQFNYRPRTLTDAGVTPVRDPRRSAAPRA